MPRHEITLTFVLAEDVTPDYFAERVAQACASQGVIRVGEGIRRPSEPDTVMTKRRRRATRTVSHNPLVTAMTETFDLINEFFKPSKR